MGVEKNDSTKSSEENPKEDNDSGNKENDSANFGIVTDEDKEADKEATGKLNSMIDERLKTKPLPPPPALDGTRNSNSELPSKSRDGDSDVDILKNGNGFILGVGIIVHFHSCGYCRSFEKWC